MSEDTVQNKIVTALNIERTKALITDNSVRFTSNLMAFIMRGGRVDNYIITLLREYEFFVTRTVTEENKEAYTGHSVGDLITTPTEEGIISASLYLSYVDTFDVKEILPTDGVSPTNTDVVSSEVLPITDEPEVQ